MRYMHVPLFNCYAVKSKRYRVVDTAYMCLIARKTDFDNLNLGRPVGNREMLSFHCSEQRRKSTKFLANVNTIREVNTTALRRKSETQQ